MFETQFFPYKVRHLININVTDPHDSDDLRFMVRRFFICIQNFQILMSFGCQFPDVIVHGPQRFWFKLIVGF